MTLKPSPGTVWIQLRSLPAGAFGANQMSTDQLGTRSYISRDRSVGQRPFQDGHLARLLRLLAIGGFHVLQLDGHLADLAGELERDLVGFSDGCALVRAHVGAFVRREGAALGPVDPTRGDLFPVDEECARAAFADPAAVVGELVADGQI